MLSESNKASTAAKVKAPSYSTWLTVGVQETWLSLVCAEWQCMSLGSACTEAAGLRGGQPGGLGQARDDCRQEEGLVSSLCCASWHCHGLPAL